MQTRLLYTALLGTVLAQSVSADSLTEQRLEQMEQRLKLLEQHVRQQQQMLHSKDQQIKQLQEQSQSTSAPRSGDNWFEKIEIGGVVEVEATHSDPENGEASNDIAVATVELSIAAPINDWVASQIVLLYEEDSTELDVDTATLNIRDPNAPWFVTAGQFGVPFGRFDTYLVSDPLTLELGETYETSLQAGVDINGFMASAYIFNGDNSKAGKHQIDNFGFDLGYGMEQGEMEFSGALGYINNIGDTDAMQDVLGANVSDYVAGWFASATARLGTVSVIGEYLGAADTFQANELAWKNAGAQPHTWNIEAAYAFPLANKEAQVALGYQASDEALGLELPENRWLLAFSVSIFDNTRLSFEWARSKDYAVDDGGSGDSSNDFTALLAVEF